MNILNSDRLDEICAMIVNNASDQPILHAYLMFLYNTGCRPSEPLTPSCFLGYTDTHLILQPLKKNLPRHIEKRLVPPSIFSTINNNQSVMTLKDYETALNRFKKLKPISLTMTNIKKSELYLFRYNYVRQLYISGLAVSDIQLHMGWKNESIVSRYLNTNIFIN